MRRAATVPWPYREDRVDVGVSEAVPEAELEIEQGEEFLKDDEP